MQIFYNADGKSILLKMVKGIQENKIYLGEVDDELKDLIDMPCASMGLTQK